MDNFMYNQLYNDWWYIALQYHSLNGFIVKQEHNVIFVSIYCEIAKCSQI